MFTQWIQSYRDLPLLINQVNASVVVFVIGNLSAYVMGQCSDFLLSHECGSVGKCHKMGDAH